jgi:AcrR family transcriptional regulator
VETPQPRERLVAALASSIEERGYRATTIADVVRIARTSRRTFYEHFADRDACFLTLFTETISERMRDLAAAVDPHAPFDLQVEQALDAYIAGITAQSALQQSFVRELPGLGEEGAEAQRLVTERYAQTLVALVESGRRTQPELVAESLPLDVAIIIVGGLRELLVISIQQGRPLHELRPAATRVVTAVLAGIVRLASGE